jgi:cupin superfamily acireductone dioxygenase involved in methionine salvage
MSYYPDLALAEKLDESYLLDNRSFVAGGIFMVSSNSIGEIKKEIDRILHEKMIDKGLINNEQIVLGYLSKKNPDLFQTFQNYHNIHRDYEILNFLQQ